MQKDDFGHVAALRYIVIQTFIGLFLNCPYHHPVPATPTNIVATALSYHSINVTWDVPGRPTGPFIDFNVTIVDLDYLEYTKDRTLNGMI